MTDIIKQLRADEGCEPCVYPDHLGFATIGVGRLVDKRKPGAGLRQAEIDMLLANDVGDRVEALTKALPWFISLARNSMPDRVKAITAARADLAMESRLLQAVHDGCDCARDLARNERLAAQRALVVEQDTTAGVQLVALPVVDRQVVSECLGAAVGRSRMEISGIFVDSHHSMAPAKHLTGACLIEAGVKSTQANRLKAVHHAHPAGL